MKPIRLVNMLLYKAFSTWRALQIRNHLRVNATNIPVLLRELTPQLHLQSRLEPSLILVLFEGDKQCLNKSNNSTHRFVKYLRALLSQL